MSDRSRERGFQLIGEPADDDTTRGGGQATFATFVLSLTASALYHLGVSPGEGIELPELGEQKIDLALGKQTIEILEVLREKTRGNLDPDEARLLDQALHDLHLRFVAVKREQS